MSRTLVRLPLLACGLLLVGSALTAPAGAVLPSSAPAPGTEPTVPHVAPDPQQPLPEQARDALAKVERILGDTRSLGSPERLHGDATLALRDLAVLKEALGPVQQRTAERYLARPTEPGDRDQYRRGASVERECVADAPVCVHWVSRAQDSVNGVPPEDDGVGGQFPGEDNDIPDYVDQVLAAMSKVHGTYVDAGYRAPESDEALGGGPQTDIYLAQVGDDQLYGYCTTDDPTVDLGGGVWAYCVLDNDYRSDEYPALTPLKNMRVTAAHEYFHAVQFGYDIGEDAWFMEATATWAEDEVYDAINDNVFYLRYGPLRRPGTPMDKFYGLTAYGSWIFFRYLADHWGGEIGGMPDIVKRMWDRADAEDGPDQYSLQAVRSVLAREGTTLAEEYADFARGNRIPRVTYEDDAVENRYPTAPLGGKFRLSPSRRSATSEFELDHLTSRALRFLPTEELDGNRWRLRVRVDLNGEAAGGVARVLVKKEGKPVRGTSIRLRDDGTGAKVFGFDSDEVKWVEVIAVNASHRFRCWKGTVYSCMGRPQHDNKQQLLFARVFKPQRRTSVSE